MALTLTCRPYTLQFKFDAGTSRGVLTSKTTWIMEVRDSVRPGTCGLGEAGPLKGLSPDDLPDLPGRLGQLEADFNNLGLEADDLDLEAVLDALISGNLPAVRFGLESALLDLLNGGKRVYFDNGFVRGEQAIPMNGLIWMGTPAFMAAQLEEKLKEGFTTIKLKIGAIGFDEECALLAAVRERFTAKQITLRVDANGAYTPEEAPARLARLAEYDLHSIEQPIRAGQPEAMARLVRESPVPVALDEELIGIKEYREKRRLLEAIRPHYIILKPSLTGGFQHTREWIALAAEMRIGWWITSALESNIGLNAIAQFTAGFENPLPQGLGTGQLYRTNFPSGMVTEKGFLVTKLP